MTFKDERLIHAKLTAILHAVNSQIFHDSESRSLILPTCCEHVKYHLVAKQELRLCCDILGDIITFLSLRKTDDLDPKRRFAGKDYLQITRLNVRAIYISAAGWGFRVKNPGSNWVGET